MIDASRAAFSLTASLRGRSRGSVERGLESVPRQRRALDANGELANAREDRKLAEGARGRADARGRGEQAVEPLEQAPALLHRLPLQALRHHRRRRGRDRAAVPLEGDVLDRSVLDVDVDRQRVAAERVAPVGFAGHELGPPEVPRPFAVVEDDLLVEIPQIAHPRNTAMLFRTAATRAATSSGVL